MKNIGTWTSNTAGVFMAEAMFHSWRYLKYLPSTRESACGTRINNELARYSWWQVGRYAWDQIIHIFCILLQQVPAIPLRLHKFGHSMTFLWIALEHLRTS